AFMALHCEDVDIPENDALGVYRSSDWAERGFCKECGTPLFWRTHDHSMYAVSATAVEISEGLRLATETFIEEKPQYYAFANDTTKVTGAEWMAMFAEDREARHARGPDPQLQPELRTAAPGCARRSAPGARA